MSNFLFTWELGSNSGHIAEILPIAKLLKKRGHTVNLLFREIHEINLNDLNNIPVFQAPIWLANLSGLPENPISLPEVLLYCGYHQEIYLTKMVDVWCNTLKKFNPDVLIANYSPTAILASRIINLPVVTIGTGFYTPPQLNPLPSARPWLKNVEQRLLDSDNRVTRTINSVLNHFSSESITSCADLFNVNKNLFLTYPELDHFQNREANQRNDFVGPIFAMSKGSKVAWPEDTNVKVFVYLRPDFRDLALIIKSLSELNYKVIAVIPGLSKPDKEKFDSNNVQIFTESIQLDSVVDDCDLAIGYGGHGLTSAMLLSNVPQVMFPLNLEQFLLAQRIESLGAGIVINIENDLPNYYELFAQAISNKKLKKSCIQFSKKYLGHNQESQLNYIADQIEKILE